MIFINPHIAAKLYPFLSGILRNMNCFPTLTGGHLNHVHILCQLPKTIALSKVIEQLKSGSSKWLKKENQVDNFAWQGGYAAYSVQYNNLAVVQDYIGNQDVHHMRLSFEDELKMLLSENSMKYDERYLWD
jgi:hypothetical protein